MSLLKKLFGLGGAEGAKSVSAAAEETYNGYTIKATPMKEGGQYRLHAVISKEIDGAVLSHDLIRADMYQSLEDLVPATMRKAKQVIDEQGERMFK